MDNYFFASPQAILLAATFSVTVQEIGELLHGFAAATMPAERWQTMAHKKLEEIEQMISQAQQMKALLGTALRCGCLRLEDCVVV